MTELHTRIVEAVVYPDRARVTRRGAVAIEAGFTRIEINELPLALDSSSVRAGGSLRAAPGKSGQARLLGVDIKKSYYGETPASQVRELEERIQSLEDKDNALADQAESLKVQAGFARSVAEKSGDHLARGVAFFKADITQGDALMRFVARELSRIQEELQQVNAGRRDLGKQLAQLRGQLNALQSSRGRERYSAIVEVDVTEPGELTLDLIYTVANSGWEPLYDIRLYGKTLELTYLGQVSQRTGEDWIDVSLVLSTARPSLAAMLPELQPWYLQVYQPVPTPCRNRAMVQKSGPPSPPAPAAGSMPMDEADKESAPVEMQAVTASVENTGASVTFRLPQPVSIPADNQPHKVTVAVTGLDTRLDLVTVPKLAEAAFRRASAKNTSPLMLLPGRAALFVEGDFTGTTAFGPVAPGEAFELYLGVDDRVFVERKLVARDVDKKLFQDKRQLRYGYEIELRNLRGEKIFVELHDQLPVSSHESVKVKPDSTDPKPAEATELGELIWKLELEPDAVRFVRFDFGIEHPRDLQVTGLP